ncbi:MAG: hypothetical protein FWF24_03920 [Alphaproteobacteria bacterium]|nr:hypothetical protein [Alphaproteobacteria bacterium]
MAVGSIGSGIVSTQVQQVQAPPRAAATASVSEPPPPPPPPPETGRARSVDVSA